VSPIKAQRLVGKYVFFQNCTPLTRIQRVLGRAAAASAPLSRRLPGLKRWGPACSSLPLKFQILKFEIRLAATLAVVEPDDPEVNGIPVLRDSTKQN
jgi:hypothetical protein